MKHKRWVFFYIFAILFLLIFALFSSGILNFQVPVIKIAGSSPDMTATRLTALCNFKKYESVALYSLKFDNKKYSRITRDDILESDLKNTMGYPAAAKSLCNTFDTSRKVEKNQISNTEWEYRYYAGVLFDSNRAYSIVYFDNDWRFVLPKWLSL